MRYESHERGDPKKGSSWASIVDASSDDEVNAGKSFIAVTTVADGVLPVRGSGKCGLPDRRQADGSIRQVEGKCANGGLILGPHDGGK